MSNTGIRYPGYDIRLYIITLRHRLTTIIPHLLYTCALIGTGWITIIYPEEGTDLHFFIRIDQRDTVLVCHDSDLSRSKFLIVLISKIFICKILKGYTIGIFFLTDDNRSSAVFVTGCIDSRLIHQQNGYRTIDRIKRKLNSFDQIFLLIDQCCDQLRCIDIAAAHF